MRSVRIVLTVTAVLCSAGVAQASDCSRTSVGFTPINDLGTGKYQGFEGGLYSGGSNLPPAAHALAGRTLAAGVGPRDPNGKPDASGRYVLISIGMSNTTAEFQRFI